MTTPELDHWNALPPREAAAEVLPCNGSRAWADGLAAQRPFVDAETLLRAADSTWGNLQPGDWDEAFASHPRIGEKHAKAATDVSLKWSAEEQSAAGPELATKAALADGNRLYEARFGRIFLVCASGKSAAEMLAILQARLGNDPETELREAVEQQRRITQLRLRKWLSLPPARCEEV